jgi:hypothetical protein
VAVKVEFAFDRDRELRQLRVADHLAELALGFEHPGGRPAQPHLAG